MTTLYQSWRDVPKAKWPWLNFSPRELACKGTGRLLLDEVAVAKLQELRDLIGRPIILTSAYRSPEYNKKVGGAKYSMHMQGCAFDVNMANHNPQEFEIAARKVGFRGFGYYPKSGFMHIDLGRERTWGTPFKVTPTLLPEEIHQPGDRENIVQSTTVQAAATQIATSAAGGVAAVSALDGWAQYIVLGFAGMILLLAVWILRERIKKWAEGVR
jgi:zinc D-Ala-D-Ala carboxypeptidase